jgi:carboxyl-terminal processing protease
VQNIKKHYRVPRTFAAMALSAVLWGGSLAWAQANKIEDFQANKAWAEFVTLLRESYAYFERESVSGEAIIKEFAPNATAAKTDEEFIAILKVVERNFADPHFLVGPRNDADMSVIPTSSDIYAEWRDSKVIVVDVRAGGSAQQEGVSPGDIVVSINDESAADWITKLLGRSRERVSALQANYGVNVALAGVRGLPRKLALKRGSATRTVTLKPAREHARAVAALPPVTHERQNKLGIIRINNSLGRNETIEAFDAALDALMDAEHLLIDLRNTPSGGNTTIARALMSRFISKELPYQIHEIPYDERKFGVRRKFVEYVAPRGTQYRGKVYVAGGRWTGSMGEGLVMGFDALGATTVGTSMAHLLGALYSNLRIPSSDARFEFGAELLFHVNGLRREFYRPKLYLGAAEASTSNDPVLSAIRNDISDKPAR